MLQSPANHIPEPEAASQIVAAIDLGSNSFHMIIAEVINGRVQIIERIKEKVQLGAGLDEAMRLTDEATTRALDCLARFAQRLRGMAPTHVRVAGTNTLRVATNGPKVMAQAEAILGYPIEVIAGREEARLIYTGVAHGYADAQERRLVLDIGGGSTECVIGSGFQPSLLESLQMGCVSYTRRFFVDGKISKKRFRDAVIAAECELQAISSAYCKMGWETAIGCSGTIQAVAQVVREQGWVDQDITRDSLDRLRDLVLTFSHVDELAAISGLKADRFSIFPSGLAILYAIFDVLQLKHMRVSDSALREGLVFELLGGEQTNIRRQTLEGLRQSFSVDVAQANRVKQTALWCFEQVAGAWQLDMERGREQLTWAADLHELGLSIAHNHFHKHGAYIIANADMFGFSRQEQHQLSVLIRNHRRKIQPSTWEGDGDVWQRQLLPIICILRLAVLLQRSRQAVELPPMRCVATEAGLALHLPEVWLESHPLTHADLMQEQGYLTAAGMDLQLVPVAD